MVRAATASRAALSQKQLLLKFWPNELGPHSRGATDLAASMLCCLRQVSCVAQMRSSASCGAHWARQALDAVVCELASTPVPQLEHGLPLQQLVYPPLFGPHHLP